MAHEPGNPTRTHEPLRTRATPLASAALHPLAGIEAALRDSETRYRQVVQSLPIAFYATDAHGRVTLFNNAAAALWGRTPRLGEVVLCETFRLLDTDGVAMGSDRCPMAQAVLEGVDREGSEAIVERSGGQRSNVLVYPRVFRDVDGRIIGAVHALVDITERKVTEAELIRSQQVLREADARKDVFIATLAHELRNPLTPIRNAMHVIRLAGDNRAAVAQTRALIERQLSQLVRLVDDLLDVSRISRGRIELRMENVELQPILRQAIETSSALVDHYGHALEVVLPGAPVHITADPARLAQVFSNLLNNAAKYTPPRGRIRLAVTVESDRVEVSVLDNGIGLPPQMTGDVFEMFTQVHTALEKSRGGLGVGLAIVRRLVEMHGGQVEAKSDGENTGSEFVVRLPIAAQATVQTSVAPPEMPDMRRADVARQRRILVVDDNVDLADSLAMMLQILGHEVRVANDGFTAVQASAEFAPDLIFLDIGMPGMNGYDTCRRIRAAPDGHAAVVIALSGWGQEQDKQRSRDAGMDLHLVKPFDPALLEQMLEKLRGRAAVAQNEHAALAAAALDGAAADHQPHGDAEEAAIGAEASMPDEAIVEAARYALFQRILPVLRHGLVGELQSVQFAVNLARHTCERSTATDEALGAIARISEQAHAAVGRGQAITDWLRPDPRATTTVGEAVHACLDLVGTEWSLRGIEVVTNVPAASRVVRAAAFRELLAAMLVALSDALPGAADVVLSARRRHDDVVVSLHARAAARDGDCARVSLCRDLRWDDVAALARAHGVNVARRGAHVMLRFPLVID